MAASSTRSQTGSDALDNRSIRATFAPGGCLTQEGLARALREAARVAGQGRTLILGIDQAEELSDTTDAAKGHEASGRRTSALDDTATQRYCCVMIPVSDSSTGYLPCGVHNASWCEVSSRFSGNGHRSRLIGGLLAALQNLAGAGCRSVLLDGSFVSQKDLPEDYDGAWDPMGVDPALLDPVLLDFSNGRAAMKSKYFGELFPATDPAAPGILYRDFFMKDRDGVPKGVVHIDLGSLP
jgi:hypothetical protein